MSGGGATEETWEATGGSGSKRSAEKLARGTLVGRYVVLSQLGAGGMGAVYAAYDPELDRKLALKLLHDSAPASRRRTALLREAKAAAKLNHPNVIAVHDVGEHEGRVYLAMELVEGPTLKQWLAAEERRWPEVLDVFVQAARGLAAAHEQGLVHRDFKPDNAMVGSDARVRVMDFGLARPSDTAEETHAPANDRDAGATYDDSIVGTPAYMAPEQHLAQAVGPPADQFAFCVALWEALYGMRPFSGSSLAELSVNVIAGQRLAPSSARVPTWLRRTCERGLATAPEDRFASMHELLAALSRGRGRARMRTIGVVLGVVALLGAGTELHRRYRHARAVAACEEEGASIESVWNDDARTALHDALVATEVPNAATTADKVLPWLDDQAAAWTAASTTACLEASAPARDGWDADVRDRSTWCLEERRLELAALVTELSGSDARSVEKAVTAAASLSQIDPCLDREQLLRLPHPPVEQRDAVTAVHAKLSRALALYLTGVYADGLSVARSALEDAEALDWPPLTAEARGQVGLLLDGSGAYAEAERALEDSYFEAMQAGANQIAFDAADRMVMNVGFRQGRHADGLRWDRHAEVLRSALPDPAGLLAARSKSNRSALHRSMGELERAAELAEEALALFEAALGAEHPQVAGMLSNLAIAYEMSARFEEARVLHERALAIREDKLGPDHPEVAASLNNLAAVHASMRELDRARELVERALAIREKALGPDHPSVAMTLGNLGSLLDQMGEYERARASLERAAAIFEKRLGPEHPHLGQAFDHLAVLSLGTRAYEDARRFGERAVAIREKALGPEHPLYARSLNNLGLALDGVGEHQRARELIERALAITRKTMGPKHPEVADSLNALAWVLFHVGEHDSARDLLEQALAIRREALGPRHADTAHALLGLAHVAVEQGRTADAVDAAEEALAIRIEGSASAIDVAQARFVLAQASWPADRARATELAAQARDTYEGAGAIRAAALAEVKQWIAAHPR